MKGRSFDWLYALITASLAIGLGVDAQAANPRMVAQVGQQVAGGWLLLDIGPRVAVNDADQVVYVAKVRKDRQVQVAVMRNRERMVWEGKQLADGSLVVDIEEDACPAINKTGAIAVHALIRKGGLQRQAVIGSDRAFTWIGRRFGGKTITRWNQQDRCAQIDDRGRIAYFAYFESARGQQRGVFVGNRPVLTAGKILSDGSEVTSISEDVALNRNGRIVVEASVSPSGRALVAENAVLLRDGEVMLDGSTIDLGFGFAAPAINDRRQIVARASIGINDDAIVGRDEVVLSTGDELPDRAVIAFGHPDAAVIDGQGNVVVLVHIEHEERRFNSHAAIVTPKGVAVMADDMLADGRRITDLERPSVSGKGKLAFVALVGGERAILLGKPTKGCRNLLDRDVPVPEGYGAAYSFSGSGLNVRIRCGFGRAMLQVGSGRSDERVNPDAFVWKQGEWRPIRLKGEERDDDGWFIGSAGANLQLTGAQLRNREQRVLAQTCAVSAFARKCGCRDGSCRETFWQLQRFRRPR